MKNYIPPNSVTENMKKFILELGKDFTYVNEEYTIMVGGEDYHVDLLFYHRKSCLIHTNIFFLFPSSRFINL